MKEYELRYTGIDDRIILSVFAPSEIGCWQILESVLSEPVQEKIAHVSLILWEDEINNVCVRSMKANAFGMGETIQ